MIQKHLILIDDNSQSVSLKRIKEILKTDGIELIYKEFNPKDYQKREGGDLLFNRDALKESLLDLPYFNYLDSIVCDYNLIEKVINGFEIVKIIKEINPYYKKQIILYSADINTVIKNIIDKNDDVVNNLEQLTKYNIQFIQKTGYDQDVIKHIKKEKPFNFEDELIRWFYSRKDDEFNYLFPKYKKKRFEEIAKSIELETTESIEFKKDLIEQIISYLSTINNLD